MKEVTYRVNIRNIRDIVERNYLQVLNDYKGHVTFLFACFLRTREKEPIVLFEEPALLNRYNEIVNIVRFQDVTTAVRNYLSQLDGFNVDLFNDLTYYIDDIMKVCVVDQVVNMISITINRFYELEVTSKQFIKKGRRSDSVCY